MKKYIVALMLVVSLAGFAAQAHAVSLDDLWREIAGLKQQVIDLKSQLGAAVLKSGVVLDASKISADTVTSAILIPTGTTGIEPTSSTGGTSDGTSGGTSGTGGSVPTGTTGYYAPVTERPTGIIGIMQPITTEGIGMQKPIVTPTPDPAVGLPANTTGIRPTSILNPTNSNTQPVFATTAASPDASKVATQAEVVMFTRNINQGERSDEVMKLQKILVGKGFLTADNATGFYGKMTVAAIRQFQAEAGIAGGDGTSVGPKTRAALSGSAVSAQAQANGNGGAAGIFPPGCTSWHGYSTTTGQPCNQLGPIQSASSILSNHLPCLLSNTTPAIKVTTPNGGETYQPGQQITVKWETCNIPASTPMFITLQGDQTVNSAYVFTQPLPGNNSGSYTLTLPTQATWNQMVYGLHYQIRVGTDTGNGATMIAADNSDNWFTIDNNQVQPACSIFQPTIVVASSTTSQYVAAGTSSGVTDATKVTYNFTSPQQVTISEMKFAVDVPMSVTSVRVGSVTAPVVSGQAWLTGLNIVVPQGGAGVNVDAFFSYAPVGVSGIPSNTQSMVDLNSVKFTCSGTGVTNTAAITVGATNKMFVVGSKPIVTVNTTPNNGLTLGTENKIGEVTVTADAHGDIKINDIQFNPWPSGFASNPTLGNPRIADGGVTITGSHCSFVPMALCEFGSASNTDYDGYVIPAGTSKTFGLYANLIYGVNNGNGSIATSLSSFEFNWDDTATNGASGTNLVGSYIYGFPIGSYLIH